MWFDLTGDLKTALRSAVKAPGTSALIVLTLAVAIGAATIGFTFADLALLRGLPVDDPSRVVSVLASDTHGSNPRARVSGPDYLDYRARSQTLHQMAVFREGRAALITNGQSQTLVTALATADLFASLGQPALLGRMFGPGDDEPGAPPVAVVAHRYWRESMGGRPDAIGRTLQLGREFVTVVGVAPPELEFGNLGEIDVWLPLTVTPGLPRDAHDFRLLARLKDGVSFEQAAAEMAAIGAALATEHPLTNGGWTVRLVPVRELTGGDGFWVVIVLFLLSITLLMAIATANVSNLVMVRAAARTREMAVRTALGARRGRLLRQFLIEGLVLSTAGAALSLPFAWAGLQAIAGISPDPVFRQLQIDRHEIGFVAVIAVICPVMYSLAPVRLITRPDMRQVLASQGGRGATASLRGRGTLVVAQVALAVILLTASTLAFKSIRHAFGQPLGFNTAEALAFGVEFNDAIYPDPAAAAAARQAAHDALAEVPGVRQVTMVDALPILGDRGAVALSIDGRVAGPGEASPTAVVTGLAADAGDVLGMPLLAGAWWTEGVTDAAVVSRAAATRYFGGVEQAVGRRVTAGAGAYRVVGVSGDVANTNRTGAPPPRVWVPLGPQVRRVTFVLTGADPAALAPGVRSAAAAAFPAVPLESLDTLAGWMRRAESSDYVVIAILGGFALLAMVLATTGLFGVVSYSVAQRAPEFGTRIALGASTGRVVALVARQSLTLLGIGLAVGLAGGVGVAFAMRSILYGTSPTDPATLAGVSALLAAVALLATAVPAWRASRIDPVVALRAE